MGSSGPGRSLDTALHASSGPFPGPVKQVTEGGAHRGEGLRFCPASRALPAL